MQLLLFVNVTDDFNSLHNGLSLTSVRSLNCQSTMTTSPRFTLMVASRRFLLDHKHPSLDHPSRHAIPPPATPSAVRQAAVAPGRASLGAARRVPRLPEHR